MRRWMMPVLALCAAGCGAEPGRPPVDLGFRPGLNGLGFPNYGNTGGITNLTPDDVRRMYGDAVCASTMGGCALTPAARRWMETSNAAMAGGHCQGFSLFSLLAFDAALNPTSFGAARTVDLARSNVMLQREIAYWMATQFVAERRAQWLTTLTPAQVVERLRESMSARREPLSIGFYRRGGGGGHAVTPWAIRGDGATTQIMVYDNNIPGQERAISVDAVANTWTYVASTRPDLPAAAYSGDAQSRNLILVPLSSARGTLPCGFCGDMGAPGPGPRVGSLGLAVRTQGDGDTLVQDDQGHRVGTGDDGTFVNDFPGAAVDETFSDDLWQDSHEPDYRVPVGRPLQVTLSGARLSGAASESELAVIGPGFEVAVLDISLDRNQRDTLSLSAAGDEVTYRTSGMETPVVSLGFSTPTSDYEFGLRVRGDSDGQSLGMILRRAESALDVVITDNDGTTYDLEAIRIDPERAPESFSHFDLSAEGTVRLRLRYGEWRGSGTPLVVEVDLGNDGTVDRTDMVTDTDAPLFEL